MKIKRDPKWLKDCGRRLIATREVLNLKQVEMATRTKITPAALNHYETGKRPIDIAYAIDLCDRFKLTLDWLYRGDTSNLPKTLAVQVEHRMATLRRDAA